MTFISLVVTLLSLVLVILYVTRPLFTSNSDFSNEDRTSDYQEDAYRAALARIRELDSDFRLGKIDEQAHAAQRTILVQEAAEILREMNPERKPTTPS